ncbi:DUF445 domain-containing protein [Listeria booriae]|uniref:DUF445 domain-containing protein n=2 Tax=Listeria booriae TaxID=1552123 RepID=A0A7X0XW82_9LIST|nr:DUF445 family protein [Listeria booriae]MBC1792766.1 DUF445 domain-containing protein [Listeria booriae]MBC1804764.1 DUF445 domain-containing protein [Listeria booriae]
MAGWMTILFMVIVGAFIGAATNFIAIRMLFRPFKAKYIGKWRVPFTPGVIPKRREELAEKIGEVVAEHLLTNEAVQAKLSEETLREELIDTTNDMVREKLAVETTPNELLAQWDMTDFGNQVPEKMAVALQGQLEQFFEKRNGQSVKTVLPEVVDQELARKIPAMANQTLQKIALFTASDAGKLQIKLMIERILAEHGKVGGMVGLFLNNDTFVTRMQKEVVKFIGKPETEAVLTALVISEWQQFSERLLVDVMPPEKQAKFTEQVVAEVMRTVQLEKWMDTPVQDWIRPYEKDILDKVVPFLVDAVLDFAKEHSADIMKRLEIGKMVQHQIEAFSLEEMEQIVLDISGKELKMITYLGGFLGGFIGILQGVIAILF